jgi:hypothetical protein
MKSVTIRLPDLMIERIGRLTNHPALAMRYGNTTRADVAREALIKGIEVLEQGLLQSTHSTETAP